MSVPDTPLPRDIPSTPSASKGSFTVVEGPVDGMLSPPGAQKSLPNSDDYGCASSSLGTTRHTAASRDSGTYSVTSPDVRVVSPPAASAELPAPKDDETASSISTRPASQSTRKKTRGGRKEHIKKQTAVYWQIRERVMEEANQYILEVLGFPTVGSAAFDGGSGIVLLCRCGRCGNVCHTMPRFIPPRLVAGPARTPVYNPPEVPSEVSPDAPPATPPAEPMRPFFLGHDDFVKESKEEAAKVEEGQRPRKGMNAAAEPFKPAFFFPQLPRQPPPPPQPQQPPAPATTANPPKPQPQPQPTTTMKVNSPEPQPQPTPTAKVSSPPAPPTPIVAVNPPPAPPTPMKKMTSPPPPPPEMPMWAPLSYPPQQPMPYQVWPYPQFPPPPPAGWQQPYAPPPPGPHDFQQGSMWGPPPMMQEPPNGMAPVHKWFSPPFSYVEMKEMERIRRQKKDNGDGKKKKKKKEKKKAAEPAAPKKAEAPAKKDDTKESTAANGNPTMLPVRPLPMDALFDYPASSRASDPSKPVQRTAAAGVSVVVGVQLKNPTEKAAAKAETATTTSGEETDDESEDSVNSAARPQRSRAGVNGAPESSYTMGQRREGGLESAAGAVNLDLSLSLQSLSSMLAFQEHDDEE